MLRRFSAFNIFIYRISGGKIMGSRNDLPLLLLTTTGRKTGKKRTVPLVFLDLDEGYVVMPGVYERPDWYRNLKADPRARVQIGREAYEVIAGEAEGEARSRIWERVPQYWRDYQAQYSAPLPIMMLQRAG